MIPWRQLGSTALPGERLPMVLYQRDTEFVIRVGSIALMSSTAHGSEEALAELACAHVAAREDARVLVGGLGMGFTLAAVLAHLGSSARVEVAELVPAVVEWNRGPLAHLAGRPLEDARVSVWEGDVVERVREARGDFDAILLDVDNGPEAFTVASNRALYTAAGLTALHAALRAGGVLGVWSVAPDREFTRRLGQAGFAAEEHTARARGAKGGRHTLWLAERRPGRART